MGRPSLRLARLVARLRRQVDDRTIDFLFELCAALHRELRFIARPDGAPWTSDETLLRGEGACRDLAVVFIDACRGVGLAARFVSGYKLELDRIEENADLHAWAEVYLPGGGWRGYDPSLGLVVADRHVAVAASCEPELAAPTTGSFRGTGAIGRMTAQVRLEPIPEE
jgi:transglutaminase-like putative cysteine protease